MLLLIDGYNLLHQSDVLGRSRAEGWLHRARMRLLRTIGQQLDADLRRGTCIVFDAEDPPPGRASQEFFEQIDVRYAVDYPEADDLLEELIAHHAAPSRLTVISSDHRVQRAIRRRRGFFFDSDVWYAKLLDGGSPLGIARPTMGYDRSSPATSEKPIGELDAAEASRWMEAFGIASQDAPLRDPSPKQASSQNKASQNKASSVKQPAPQKRSPKRPKPSSEDRRGNPRRNLDREGNNPFPDGYGEDLL